MKKITLHSEPVYFLGLLIMSLSVAMIAPTDYGVSMIVAPAYLLSLKFPIITFGQAEYIVQGLLFVVFCILMKRVKPVYFSSFVSGLIYGAMLDGWRLLIPHFNPDITPVGSLSTPLKLTYFILGITMTAFAVALLFRTYIYPQVYDFFVKGISERYKLDRNKFKIVYDASSLALSFVMTLVMFGGFRGIGWGTIVTTAINGVIIGFFGHLLDKYVEVKPLLPKLAKCFEL